MVPWKLHQTTFSKFLFDTRGRRRRRIRVSRIRVDFVVSILNQTPSLSKVAGLHLDADFRRLTVKTTRVSVSSLLKRQTHQRHRRRRRAPWSLHLDLDDFSRRKRYILSRLAAVLGTVYRSALIPSFSHRFFNSTHTPNRREWPANMIGRQTTNCAWPLRLSTVRSAQRSRQRSYRRSSHPLLLRRSLPPRANQNRSEVLHTFVPLCFYEAETLHSQFLGFLVRNNVGLCNWGCGIFLIFTEFEGSFDRNGRENEGQAGRQGLTYIAWVFCATSLSGQRCSASLAAHLLVLSCDFGVPYAIIIFGTFSWCFFKGLFCRSEKW